MLPVDFSRSKAWVWGRFESRRGHGCLSLVSVVCCQFASGWSLVRWSPTECGVYECDLETSKMRRPGPNRPVQPYKIICFWAVRRGITLPRGFFSLLPFSFPFSFPLPSGDWLPWILVKGMWGVYRVFLFMQVAWFGDSAFDFGGPQI